jgi:hypothetical protein
MEQQKQLLDHLICGFAVEYVGCVHPDNEQATDCIYNDMALSALDELAP